MLGLATNYISKNVLFGKFSYRYKLIAAAFTLLLSWMAVAPVSAASLQPGSVDPTFQSGKSADGPINSLAVQSDGKILIAGGFVAYNNTNFRFVGRLNSDGSADTTFTSGNANDQVQAVVVQSDGKIIIAGRFNFYNGVAKGRIVRLNSNGTLDTTFNPGGTGASNIIYSLGLQSDGKILVGGFFTNFNGTTVGNLVRLNNDGTLDTTFNPGGAGANGSVSAIAFQSDGKILIGGNFFGYNGATANFFARLNADGTFDTSFNSGGEGVLNSGINVIGLQADGKILIGGTNSFTYNGIIVGGIARLNSNGTLDTTFNSGGAGANGGVVSTLGLQSDGKIVIAGAFTSYNGVSTKRVTRLNLNGTLDTTFNPGGAGVNNTVNALAIASDDKTILGGSFSSYNGIGVGNITRLNLNGTFDTTFNPGGGAGADSVVNAIVVGSDGKILIGGQFTTYNGTNISGIARLNPDGTLDTTFNPGGTGANISVNAIAVQSDGKILIGGFFNNYNGTTVRGIARLNPNGTLDTTFNPGGSGTVSPVYAIELQSDGKILIAGSFLSYNGTSAGEIIRLNADGTRDTTFNPGGVGATVTIFAMKLQSDGKILIGGQFTSYNGTTVGRLARLNSDGTLDTTFNAGGAGANNDVFALLPLSDGKTLVGGFFNSYNGTTVGRLMRLNTDGTLDTTFNPGGAGSTGAINVLSLTSDGKILIGGNFTSYNGTIQIRVARLTNAGLLDATFNPGSGPNNQVSALATTSDGKVLIGGSFNSVASVTRDRLARLESKYSPTLTVTSNPAPSELGQNVTFTATFTPTSTTGSVQFVFGGSVNTTVTATINSGIATYITNTLPLGDTPVTATYAGAANYNPSVSLPYTHTVVANPLVVTLTSDNGAATSVGTFSFALGAATNGQTITFALAQSNLITFTGSLTLTVPVGVTVDGGVNGVILEGNGVAGDGLRLAGNNTLRNLTIRHFAGRELVTLGTNNKLYLVRIES